MSNYNYYFIFMISSTALLLGSTSPLSLKRQREHEERLRVQFIIEAAQERAAQAHAARIAAQIESQRLKIYHNVSSPSAQTLSSSQDDNLVRSVSPAASDKNDKDEFVTQRGRRKEHATVCNNDVTGMVVAAQSATAKASSSFYVTPVGSVSLIENDKNKESNNENKDPVTGIVVAAARPSTVPSQNSSVLTRALDSDDEDYSRGSSPDPNEPEYNKSAKGSVSL